MPTRDDLELAFYQALAGSTFGTLSDAQFAAYNGASKQSAYSFGGTTDSAFAGYTAMSQRQRMQANRTMTQVRIRIRNIRGSSEQNPGGLVTMTGVSFGLEGNGLYTADLANTVTLVRDTTVSTGVINGTNEWVSNWTTLPFDTKNKICHISYGYTLPTTTDYMGQGSEGHGRFNSDSTSWALAASPATDFNYAAFEVIAEYRYVDPVNRAKNVLFVCHSVLATYSGNDTSWQGQMSGAAQQWARRTGNNAIVNGYTGTRTTDWAPASIKWARFPGITPDAIVLHLITNDIIQGAVTTLAAAQANYTTLINTAKSKYPGVPIYVALEQPYGATGSTVNGTVITTTMNSIRDGINTWLATLDSSVITGVFDFDAALRGPDASASARSQAFDPLFAAPDGQHPNVRGHDRLSDAITLV